MTTRTTLRYYAYSPAIGRMRVPQIAGLTRSITDDEAIAWAAGRGAVNVVREDGPASKPTGITLVWTRDEPTLIDRQAQVYQELADRFPKATVREIAEAAQAIAAIFKDNE